MGKSRHTNYSIIQFQQDIKDYIRLTGNSEAKIVLNVGRGTHHSTPAMRVRDGRTNGVSLYESLGRIRNVVDVMEKTLSEITSFIRDVISTKEWENS